MSFSAPLTTYESSTSDNSPDSGTQQSDNANNNSIEGMCDTNSSSADKENVLCKDKFLKKEEVSPELDSNLSDINILQPKLVPPNTTAETSKHLQQSVYHIKWVHFRGQNVATITQNENGPCPLLAIVNVLLLQRKIKMPLGIEVVAVEELVRYLADYIFENIPKVSIYSVKYCILL